MLIVVRRALLGRRRFVGNPSNGQGINDKDVTRLNGLGINESLLRITALSAEHVVKFIIIGRFLTGHFGVRFQHNQGNTQAGGSVE